MNIGMNGKKIRALYWYGGNEPPTMRQGGEFYLSATYHGDHDEFWVVQTKDDKEIARYNPRYIETLVWGEA